MTLDVWLDRAFGIFPRGVQEALHADYVQVFQDRGWPQENAGARLGPPARAELIARRVYLTLASVTYWDERLKHAGTVTALVVLGSAALLSLFDFGSPVCVAALLALAGMALVWVLTGRLAPLRQTRLRCVCGLMLLELTSLVAVLHFPTLWSIFFAGLVFLGVLGVSYGTWEFDGQTRRTLSPDGQYHRKLPGLTD